MSLMPIMAPFNDAPVFLAAVSTNGAYPTVQDGDFGVLLQAGLMTGFSSPPDTSVMAAPSGFVAWNTSAVNYQYGPSLHGRVVTRISSRSLTASLSGTSIGSTTSQNTLLVFRHPRGETVNWFLAKAQEFTPSFSGPISFGSVISPQIPIFGVVKTLFGLSGGYYVPFAQGYPSVLFDGAPGTNYGVSVTGGIAQVSFLTGSFPPRTFDVSLDAANPGGHTQYTRHAANSMRRVVS